ncbi:hypothetical protein BCR36DRAFT_408560 [Piromyces finnis]|uniref:Uncharacterized protein n=1 Tax=Piromyces finnis TaxID=1754191 RepID=A0A1Y1VNJ2_9FUNG|nr:hypothetical protein BCR36DRAFT_408560 [Piromyces finnis]|eukprot:ORX60202.1 hypothetical protein BCR36DRAFT_408560 [Piromyces finnis]
MENRVKEGEKIKSTSSESNSNTQDPIILIFEKLKAIDDFICEDKNIKSKDINIKKSFPLDNKINDNNNLNPLGKSNDILNEDSNNNKSKKSESKSKRNEFIEKVNGNISKFKKGKSGNTEDKRNANNIGQETNNDNNDRDNEINSFIRKKNKHSKNYMDHIYKLKMKKRFTNRNKMFNNDISLYKYNDLFKNHDLEIVKKALDVTKNLFVHAPYPLNSMNDCYIKVIKLLGYSVSSMNELKDAENLCKTLFSFLLNCRSNLHIYSNYCCKKLNRRPLVSIPEDNTNIYLGNFYDIFKYKTEKDLIIMSNNLDYQWVSLEYLLSYLFNNYLKFCERNKQLY